MPGMELLAAPCYSFLIKHENRDAKSKYDTMLFDLGMRKDTENSPKAILEMVKTPGFSFNIEKDIIDILKDNGEDPDEVGGIIWSHWHVVSILWLQC